MEDRVYIVIVNWNGWQHTTACLESLFRQQYTRWNVVVCDNASTDHSIEHLKAWAAGHLEPVTPANAQLQAFVSPAVPKPIPYVEYGREDVIQGAYQVEPDVPLVFIHTGANLGFAGGNNVGLQYVMQQSDYAYIWLLNNDTVVHPEALSRLVDKIQRHPAYGICGATVAYQDDINRIQTRGGSTHLVWLGQTRHIGFLEPTDRQVTEAQIEQQMSCVVGACMLVTKAFLQDVGLLSEPYFLYYEELDWALRSRPYGYQFAYASQALVYHKEGGSTGGGNRDRTEKSWTADYYEIRNRLVLTRTFYPWAVPTVCLSLIVTLINRLRRRQWDRLGMVLQAAIEGFKVKVNVD